MTCDTLVRLGEWLSGRAMPLDVDLAAVELGSDPCSRHTLMDLAALGVTRSAWRRGPVEDWHIADRIGQVEMMRANAAMTRRVHRLLADLLPERWWTWDVRVGLRTDAMLLWTVLAREISALDRCLPDGRTVAVLPPDGEQAVDYRNHVLWCRSRWLAFTAEYGLRVTVMMLACHGAWKCRRWWLHPDWPLQVGEFVGYLREPTGHPDAGVGSAIPELQRQGRLADPDEIRHGLLAGPDLLDADTAADCYWMGLASISPLSAGAVPFGIHPEFLNLLEPPRELSVPGSVGNTAEDGPP